MYSPKIFSLSEIVPDAISGKVELDDILASCVWTCMLLLKNISD